MAEHSTKSLLLSILRTAAPFLVLAYFLLSLLWSILMLQTPKTATRAKLRTAVRLMLVLGALTYLLEALLVTFEIFHERGILATKGSHVYAFAGVLVWALLTSFAFRADDHVWYPYIGAWLISGVIDICILGLESKVDRQKSPLDWLQVAFQTARITTTVLLLAAMPAIGVPKETPVDEEETTPLLNGSAQAKSTATANGGTYADTIKRRVDRATKKRERERDEALNKFHSHVEEEGNWFTYARRFLVFWPYLWPTRRPRLLINMAGVAVCLVAERALNIVGPRQFGILVNNLTDGFVGPSFSALALYILFDYLNSSSGLRGLRNALWLPVEANARVSLDTKSYNHVMELSCDFHDNKEDGKLYAAMRQGYAVTSLLETLLYQLAPMITDLVLALVYFRILFDSYLVLIASATMLAYMMSAAHFANYQATLQRRMNTLNRQKWHYQYETMGKWSTVAYYNRIPHVEGMYAATTSIWSGMWQKARWVALGSAAAQNTILDAGLFGALTFAAYQVVVNGKDIGSFMTLVTYWGKFTGPIANLSSTHREILSDLVDAEELRALFEKKSSVVGGEKDLVLDRGEVTFENISFSYDGKSTIIDDLSLKVSPGQTIAFIGETGAGKSTLLKLLFRFYDPNKGSIKIDGQDIRDVSLDSLREHIGVVPQEPVLFNDTILANLRFGKLDVTEEEAFEACKAAAIHDRIEKFADGYDSLVGDRGVKLSGGERQRVAIARTMLKDPKIIILDEATSSVDNETEELIQAGLGKLCAGRTTFVIAHRLSTVMNADLIVVVKEGKILEQGTSRELFKRKGKYYSLWSKQMGIIDALTKDEEDESPTESGSEQTHDKSDVDDTQTGMSRISSRTMVSNRMSDLQRSSEQSMGSNWTGQSRLRPQASVFVPEGRTRASQSS